MKLKKSILSIATHYILYIAQEIVSVVDELVIGKTEGDNADAKDDNCRVNNTPR